MGAVAVLHWRDGSPVERQAFERVFSALDHRGLNGRDEVVRSQTALGHQHFWTTPEGVGEKQPLFDPKQGLDIVFDGRLDNRGELLAALDAGAGQPTPSDASLALQAYATWGERCFDRLLGPFAVVVLDPARRSVVCARDAMGDRTLCYVLDEHVLAVATEEQALLTLPWVSSRLNETTLARFLALEGPVPGETFFAQVRELPPAHVMVVTPETVTLRRTWEPDLQPRIHYRRDEDYVDHFRTVFDEAVRCRLRSASPPAVLMSGGLDSAPVAAVAAMELAKAGRRLTTVSYVFDELTTCDERRFMDPMVERFGLDARRFAGDDAWPLSNLSKWPVNPSSPMEGLYRELRTRSYAAARQEGAAVLLTGEHGDAMYPGGEHWLADLLREGRYGASLMQLGTHVLVHDVLRRPMRYGLRAAFGHLARSWGFRRESSPPGAMPPEWLTPFAAGLLTASPPVSTSGARARRPAQHSWVLDPATARGLAVEQFHAAQAGIEVRWPFRDRRLVEFALGIPAHQLYRPGESKRIMRRAMKGRLPDEIRLRRRPTSIRALFDRGPAERELPALETILGNPNALWRRYVDAGWMASVFPGRLRTGQDGADLVVPWQCAMVELWMGGRAGEGGACTHSRGRDKLHNGVLGDL